MRNQIKKNIVEVGDIKFDFSPNEYVDVLNEFTERSKIEIVKAEDACHWSMKYRSVIGFGKAVFLEDLDEKRKVLNIIMSQYSDRSFQFNDAILKKMAVIKVEIESMTGKQSGL